MSRMALICELDPKELAVRIAEGLSGQTRPPDMSVDEALGGLRATQRRAYLRAAEAAIAYMVAQTSGGPRQ